MCSIIGYFNFKNCIGEVTYSLNVISYRGPDGCGIYFGEDVFIFDSLDEIKDSTFPSKSSFCIGHSLLSIVDFVPQPLKGKGILVCNCEIYNWKEISKKYGFSCKNDADVLLKLLDKKGIDNVLSVLDELDGSYSFCYMQDSKLVLARDILGIKPLFYYFYEVDKKFAFASEKKALPKGAVEVSPKEVLFYDLEKKCIFFKKREFFKLGDEHLGSYNQIKNMTKDLLLDAIRKRVPENQKLGILFSGGVDSVFLAYVLKKLGVKFTCYTAKLEGGNIKEAQDLVFAKEIAEKYGFDLRVATISVEELEDVVVDVVKFVEDRDYIKTSVALPFYLASKMARGDGVKVMFSGLGSEEIFAGYNRHKKVKDVNLECLEGLKILHIRDLYRDDVVMMANGIELRLPFLDNKLIEYCLNIPSRFKLDLKANRSKIILRDIAKDMGLDERFAERQKQAAQYGSKFDKGLLRLAKNIGGSKEDYLNSLDVGDIDLKYY